MTDRNESLRLAEWLRQNSSGIYRPAADAADLLDKQAERIAELEGERDQHKHTATSLLSLLADIRMACGDNGKRMQPELVEFIGAMKAERDQLRAEVERLRAREMACATVNEAEIIALVRMGQELAESMGLNPLTASPADIVNAARTTHKDEG